MYVYGSKKCAYHFVCVQNLKNVISAKIWGYIIQIYKYVFMKKTVCSDTKAHPKTAETCPHMQKSHK
jgi:hypothetical protein